MENIASTTGVVQCLCVSVDDKSERGTSGTNTAATTALLRLDHRQPTLLGAQQQSHGNERLHSVGQTLFVNLIRK